MDSVAIYLVRREDDAIHFLALLDLEAKSSEIRAFIDRLLRHRNGDSVY